MLAVVAHECVTQGNADVCCLFCRPFVQVEKKIKATERIF